jgi:hypothetical protein
VECPRTRGSELRWRTGRTLPDAARGWPIPYRGSSSLDPGGSRGRARSAIAERDAAAGRLPARQLLFTRQAATDGRRVRPACPTGPGRPLPGPRLGWSSDHVSQWTASRRPSESCHRTHAAKLRAGPAIQAKTWYPASRSSLNRRSLTAADRLSSPARAQFRQEAAQPSPGRPCQGATTGSRP